MSDHRTLGPWDEACATQTNARRLEIERGLRALLGACTCPPAAMCDDCEAAKQIIRTLASWHRIHEAFR